MLRSLKELEGYRVHALDGEIGHVVNFLLEDETWTSRYLVVRTGGFMDDREVLITPLSFRTADWASRLFHVALTKAMIRQSPGTETDMPVSRQHERDYFRYYGYPNYWGSSGIWGMNAMPIPLAPSIGLPAIGDEDAGSDDVHLRSAKEIGKYHIEGSDGELGHVEDFIVDDETWGIRYLVVNTSNWWMGKKVLVSPFWADAISWETGLITLGLSRKEIKDCPEWNADAPVNRKYEERLFDYYGRPVYWDRTLPLEDHASQGSHAK